MADEDEMKDITDEEVENKLKELEEAVIDKVQTEAAEGNAASYGGYPGSNAYRPELGNIPSSDEIREKMSWLPEMIDEILKPKPSNFDTIIDESAKLRDMFGTESDAPGGESRLRNIDTSKNAVQAWDGVFADNLVEHYFAPMEDVRGNHGRIAKVLNENAIAMKATVIHARGQAKRVLEDGISAIDAIQDSKGSDLGILLAILTGGLTMVTPLLPSKKAVELSVAGLSTLLSNLGEAAPEEQEEVPLGSDTPQGVMDNVKKAMEKVMNKREEDEDNIIKALEKSEDAIFDKMSATTYQSDDDPIYAPQPTIMEPGRDPSDGFSKD